MRTVLSPGGGNPSGYITEPSRDRLLPNRYKILRTPWVRLDYSAYINHTGETKDVIKGTSVGVAYEWTVHNVGYEAASGLAKVGEVFDNDTPISNSVIDRCDPVDLDATVFADTGDFLSARWFASEAMKVGYALTSPMAAIVDYVIKIFD